VQLVAVGGNVVVVVLSPPSGAIVVIIEDVGLGLVVWALLVQPAITSIMATAIIATAPSLRAVVITPPGGESGMVLATVPLPASSTGMQDSMSLTLAAPAKVPSGPLRG
jgi:hypothetical protein